MRVGSLFSGYGGLTIAVHQVLTELGLDPELAWVSEIDRNANIVLENRFAGIPNLGDITKVDWADVALVDVLEGGSPCTNLSSAGKREGIKEGTASGLWFYMAEAIKQLKPQLVFWENVAGCRWASAQGGHHCDNTDCNLQCCKGCLGTTRGKVNPAMRALGRVVADLSNLGYDARWTTLRAKDIGACHNRERVFVIAWRRNAEHPGHDARSPERRLPSQNHPSLLAGSTQSSLTLLPTPTCVDMGEGKTIDWWDKWTVAKKAQHGNGNGHGNSLAIEMLKLPTPVARDGKGRSPKRDRGPGLPDALAMLPSPRATDGVKGGHGSKGDLMLPSAVIQCLPTPTAADSVSSGAYGYQHAPTSITLTDAVVRLPEQFGRYAEAIRHHADIVGSLPPEPLEHNPRSSNPQLNPAFVEWMMMLPPGWVTEFRSFDRKAGEGKISRANLLKLLGNGVVPAQAVAAYRQLLAECGERKD